MAVKFLDVPEKAADILRKRVFQALRDERAAQASPLTRETDSARAPGRVHLQGRRH